ncbi:MAG: hypothetical protein SOX25_08705, partial [Eubacteriales bacterium]|nr:hypothetical protein [Eubacteriales bacterium]
AREALKKADSYEIEGILYKLGGWKKYEGSSSGKARFIGYGVQKCYVRNIKDGKIKKKNGRDFGDVSRVAFYCYVIGDLTPSLKESAESRGLTQTQDKEGYFGYNPTYGAYVEVISYDKLLKDAKQRNKALFDKLFEPKAKDLVHPELLGRENKS